MRRRVVLFQAFYNFARPHMSLRLPLAEQEPHASGLIQPKCVIEPLAWQPD